MKIAICTIGSRGDVQPFLVLGDFLSKRGHTVRFSSALMYQEMANSYQVEYHPFEGDYEALVNDEEMKKMIGKNPFTISKKLNEHVYPILENSLETFYEQALWADVVIYHPKALLDAIGEGFQHKLLKAYVVPLFSPTKEFRSPLFAFMPLPSCLNRWTHNLTNSLMNTVKKPIQNFKKRKELGGKIALLDTPVIYGISTHFLPQPKDYPKGHIFTGFWMSKEESKVDLDSTIVEFLASSKKKMVITFGSMPYKSTIPIQDFIAGIQAKSEVKIVLVKAWGLKDVKIVSTENLLVIDRAPFDKLFPLVDAVVHHGGAGTTAIALQSGRPQMICPILHPVGDQLFWGRQIEKKGLGVRPIPLKKLTVSKLAASVEELLNTDYSKATLEIQEQLKQENGLQTAALFIEKKFNKQEVVS